MHSVEGETEAEKPEEGTAREEEEAAEDGKTDGPAMESAPEGEYKRTGVSFIIIPAEKASKRLQWTEQGEALRKSGLLDKDHR